jgi:succinate dehydrogenase/fumarate reductase cytochrome b subunit
MKALGTLIQAGLLAVCTIYLLPHLVAGIREIIQELKDSE